MRSWKILCDFDGTISLRDATDELLEQCAQPQWRELEQEWRSGAIGSRECMSRQVALLDASEQEIHRVLDGIAIDPAFPRFIGEVSRLGIPLTIVSDGLDVAIKRILGNHGLSHLPVVSNRLERVDSRRWAMRSPFADPDCRAQSGTCKCAYARLPPPADRARNLLIGDGQSDVCVASRADFVFAKHRLLDYCGAAGISHRPIGGFDDAIALLPDLLAGRFDLAPLPTLSLPTKRSHYA
ncbi:MAG: phosphatase [Lysobacter sp.]|nr:MAG: phosphatase [Lysobacter sp.]